MSEFETRAFQHGPLRFTALAQGNGPVVLCLHGFPDHARSFRHQLPALAEAGYRAIAPTLRGYEPSSQPSGRRYFLVDLVDDLRAWIDQLGQERVSVIGHDWGALVAQAASALIPDRLRCVATLAVPHLRRMEAAWREVLPRQLRYSWYAMFFQLRGLADWAVRRDDWALIDRLWRSWSPGWPLPPDERRALHETFALPGVQRAALEYYRCNLGGLVRGGDARRSLDAASQRCSVPTLAMTGERDGCVDTRVFDHGDWRTDYLGPARLVRVTGAGHFLHQEKPQQVNAELLDWLRQHGGG